MCVDVGGTGGGGTGPCTAFQYGRASLLHVRGQRIPSWKSCGIRDVIPDFPAEVTVDTGSRQPLRPLRAEQRTPSEGDSWNQAAFTPH